MVVYRRTDPETGIHYRVSFHFGAYWLDYRLPNKRNWNLNYAGMFLRKDEAIDILNKDVDGELHAGMYLPPRILFTIPRETA